MNPEIDENGTKRWWLKGRLKGRLHRIDGLAIEWFFGYKSWWLNGYRLTEQDWMNKVLFNEVKISSI